MKIIPAIDLRDGRVVRLRQGDFDQSRSFDVDAAKLAREYVHAGADWLHVVDLDGARAGSPAQTSVLTALAAAGARLQWGGGVRRREDVQTLLDAGASRVVVGSVAARDPERFGEWLGHFGSDRLCLALDLRQDPADGRWRIGVDAWQANSDRDIGGLLDDLGDAGLRHVLSTDIGRDGLAQGPNLALYEWLAGDWPQLAWIASGGVRNADDVAALAGTGVAACVAGTALLEGSLPMTALAA